MTNNKLSPVHKQWIKSINCKEISLTSCQQIFKSKLKYDNAKMWCDAIQYLPSDSLQEQ